jgi:hypothetical protein
LSRAPIARLLLEHHGRAVGEQLRRALGDRGGREADVENRVGAGGLGLRAHPRDRLLARILEQLRVPLELTADQVLQAGHEITADVLCPHRAPLHQPQMLGDLPARDVLERGQ